MHDLPHDLPNDAPLPDDKPRCASVFDGKRCIRVSGHEQGAKKTSRHHVGADRSRWIVGRGGGEPQKLSKCGSRYGDYRCDQWPHHGPHTATVDSPEGMSERLQWTGSKSSARRYVPQADRPVASVLSSGPGCGV